MKSAQEVSDLKHQWYRNPHWDIETTEGFEEHRDELLDFRLSCEKERETANAIARYEDMARLGVGNALYDYLTTLERQVEKLENQVEEMTGRIDWSKPDNRY